MVQIHSPRPILLEPMSYNKYSLLIGAHSANCAWLFPRRGLSISLSCHK
jgi:hypothetical protein